MSRPLYSVGTEPSRKISSDVTRDNHDGRQNGRLPSSGINYFFRIYSQHRYWGRWGALLMPSRTQKMTHRGWQSPRPPASPASLTSPSKSRRTGMTTEFP